MAEVLTIIGLVASCDQILKRLNTLYIDLRTACKCIRFAKNDVGIIKNRTWIVIKLWRFFRDCLNKVSEIKDISPDFGRYMKINQSLESQANEVSHKIKVILKDLDPLWTTKPVPAWREWYAKLSWLTRNQEETRLLFADMDLLIEYMQVYILLVQLQISVQQYKLSKSAATGLQVEMLEEMINTGLRGLRCIQHSHYTSRSDERSVVSDQDSRYLFREIRAIVREEMRDIRNDLHFVLSPRSAQIFTTPSDLQTPLPSSPVQRDDNPITCQRNSAEILLEPYTEASHSHDLNNSIRNDLSYRYFPTEFYPSSMVSYVSNQENPSPTAPADNQDLTRTTEAVSMEGTAREGEESENSRVSRIQDREHFVPTALFGSPEGRYRQA